MSDSELNDQQRRLRNLVVMALADGSIGEREVNLVAERCFELGLGEDDLQKAIEFGLGDQAGLDLPETKEERDELMKDLVRMMAADGRLDEGEKRLFALAAVKMGIAPDELDELISSVMGN